MMKRITYVSRFAQPLTSDQLEQLGRSAAEKNRQLELTGVLMASGGIFYQVLEGPEGAVDDVYRTIEEDERHTDVLLLREERPVDARLFPDWSMRTINLDAASHVRLLPLKALIKAVFEQRRLQDNMVWAIERTVQHEMSSGI